MRKTLPLLLAVFLVSAHAFEWRSEIFHCSANLPDSTGWKVIEALPTPGITVVVAMQNPGKQAVFGINIVEKLPGTDLADPAVKRAIEELLRKFSYQAIGHSIVKISGIDWLQYPVQSGSGAERITGMVRFTSAGGRVFSITALRGGGQEAAQDVELQQAAASFRILETMPPAKPTIAQSASTPPPPVAPTASKDAVKAPPAVDQPATGLGEKRRLILYAAGGIAALLVFLKIISSGKSAKR